MARQPRGDGSRGAEQQPLLADTLEGTDSNGNTSDTATRSSAASAALNLSNTIVGAGLMSLPFCFRVLGLAGGTILLLVTALITDQSLRMLVRASDVTSVMEYDRLSTAVVGKALGANVVWACILINNYGILVVDLIIIGDILSGKGKVEGLMHHITGAKEGAWFCGRAFTTFAIALCLEVPLCCARTLNAQRVSSMIALIAPAITFLTMLWRIVSTALSEGISEPRIWPDPSQPLSIISTLSVLFTAYQCHYNIHPQVKELKHRTLRTMYTVISSSVGSTTVLYLMVAIGGSLLFGADTEPDVLLNFAGNHVKDVIVKASYLLAVAFSFPVVFFTLGQTVSKLLLNTSEPQPLQSFIMTLVIIASQALLAVVARDIKVVLKLIGSLVASVLGYALPGAIAAKVEQTRGGKAVAWTLFGFAVAVGVLGLVDQIPELIEKAIP